MLVSCCFVYVLDLMYVFNHLRCFRSLKIYRNGPRMSTNAYLENVISTDKEDLSSSHRRYLATNIVVEICNTSFIIIIATISIF